MGWFHPHDYELVEKTEVPSAWEQMDKSGTIPKTIKSSSGLFARMVIFHMRCKICGVNRIQRFQGP